VNAGRTTFMMVSRFPSTSLPTVSQGKGMGTSG
jgi:hypothetical protein